MTHPLYVTQPSLPPLEQFTEVLGDIWSRKWLTNNGHYHRELEQALAEYLGVEYVSLFCNGTIALQVGLQALEISGEVITTPFSFPATTHALHWNRCMPVFCDVDPNTGNLDPEQIERAISDSTTAILPVHVYGTPCDVDAIREIADRHGLKVLYDAAHAFNVKIGSRITEVGTQNSELRTQNSESGTQNSEPGTSILNFGDLSMLSFHATKVYNTIEGGALIANSAEMKQRIDRLKNFGFVSEAEVCEAGTNGKMNEVQAAYGLLQLKTVDEQIARRLERAEQYRERLKDVPGLRLLDVPAGVQPNGSYFPVFIDANEFGMTRDALYDALKEQGIFARRYFHPLISEFPMYQGCQGASPENLPNATKISREVLCLPLFADMTEADVDRVTNAIQKSANA